MVPEKRCDVVRLGVRPSADQLTGDSNTGLADEFR